MFCPLIKRVDQQGLPKIRGHKNWADYGLTLWVLAHSVGSGWPFPSLFCITFRSTLIVLQSSSFGTTHAALERMPSQLSRFHVSE